MSCAVLDRDQCFLVHDFGPSGYVGDFTVNLTHGFHTGAMFNVVCLTHDTLNIALYDAKKNALYSFQVRIAKNELACNSLLDGSWGEEIIFPKNTWTKGVRATFSLLNDEDGYRIFINGQSALFFKHRSSNRPSHVEIVKAQIFKILYNTSVPVIP